MTSFAPPFSSIADGNFNPAYVEKVRVINVNNVDWTVNVVTFEAGKRHFDVQVMSPYFHYDNGEGMYVMPEVGALGWICYPSSGGFDTPFLLGFAAPFDEGSASFRSNRQTLQPGDMMMRTRDENFVIVRRGGVVQLGATPTAQRIYVPVRNFIRDFCENYQLFTFGGELTWITERDDKTETGDAPTTFRLKAKEKANDKEHIAELTIGSHEGDEHLTMKLVIWTDGTEDRETRVTLQITDEGDVTWDIERDWTQNIIGKMTQRVTEEISIETEKSYKLSAKKNIEVTSDADHKVTCANSEVKADEHKVDAPKIFLGGGASEPGVLGDTLVGVLKDICSVISKLEFTDTHGPAPPGPGKLPVLGAAAISGPQGKLDTILAQITKIE